MNETTNLKLKKPERIDFVLIDDMDENFEKIDQEFGKIEEPEFDDSGTVEGITSFPSYLETLVSETSIFQFFRNLKAGLKFVLHAGMLVNNCTSDRTDLALTAAQGKDLMDKYTQLNSDLTTQYQFMVEQLGYRIVGELSDIQRLQFSHVAENNDNVFYIMMHVSSNYTSYLRITSTKIQFWQNANNVTRMLWEK